MNRLAASTGVDFSRWRRRTTAHKAVQRTRTYHRATESWQQLVESIKELDPDQPIVMLRKSDAQLLLLEVSAHKQRRSLCPFKYTKRERLGTLHWGAGTTLWSAIPVASPQAPMFCPPCSTACAALLIFLPLPHGQRSCARADFRCVVRRTAATVHSSGNDASMCCSESCFCFSFGLSYPSLLRKHRIRLHGFS